MGIVNMMVSYQYTLTTGYSIMADSPNQFDHMLTEERLYLDPHDKSTHTSTKYSSLPCPDISKQFYTKTNSTRNIFFLLLWHKKIMFKTDYYFGDALTVNSKVTSKKG